jgi:hypothetical protein
VVSVPVEHEHLANRITSARLAREAHGPTALIEAIPLDTTLAD